MPARWRPRPPAGGAKQAAKGARPAPGGRKPAGRGGPPAKAKRDAPARREDIYEGNFWG